MEKKTKDYFDKMLLPKETSIKFRKSQPSDYGSAPINEENSSARYLSRDLHEKLQGKTDKELYEDSLDFHMKTLKIQVDIYFKELVKIRDEIHSLHPHQD